MRITYILTLISIFSDDDSSDEDNSSVEMEHVHKKRILDFWWDFYGNINHGTSIIFTINYFNYSVLHRTRN